MTCMMSLLSRHGERHERDHARTLDRYRNLALVQCAVARNPARNDFAAVGNEVLERLGIFVVDRHVLIGAEATDLASREATTTLARISPLGPSFSLRALTTWSAWAATILFIIHRHS